VFSLWYRVSIIPLSIIFEVLIISLPLLSKSHNFNKFFFSHFLLIEKMFLFCYLILWCMTKIIIIFINEAGRHAHSRSMLEVPIFWFIHSEPLLLDKHFQAIALSDMIIVVQSEPSSWESHLHCNGHSLLMNLRLESEIYFCFITAFFI
jgi:hypothetical protein